MTTSETAEAMLAARAPEPLGVWRRRNANRPGGDNDGDARRRAGRAVQRRPVVLRRYSRAAHRRGPGISAPFDSVLTEAVDALKNGQLSSRELTLACVERAHSWQPEINALLAIEKERALASADAADSARARGETLGLLHGVPFAQKDMYDRAGQETSCGSKIRTDHIASLTATVLERLDAAGAVDLGRLNMSEFALGPTGLNAHFGRARNPWNVDIATGGSSSGSGAAIAAGLIYGALGSNTEGSIRLPAALCGVAGLKPTQGRVSRFGAIPLSTSQDCVGPLAPTVRDVALIYQAIAGPDPRDGACSNRQVAIPTLRDDLKGVRIGIPKRFYGEDVDPEFSAVITESRRRFDGMDAALVDVDLPDQRYFAELANIVAITEAATVQYDWLRDRGQDYDEQARARLLQGLAIPGRGVSPRAAIARRDVGGIRNRSVSALRRAACSRPAVSSSEIRRCRSRCQSRDSGRRGRHDAIHASLFVSRPACACAADWLFRRRLADRDAACRAAFRREPAAGDWRRIRDRDRFQASPASAEPSARDSRRSLT
jgi:aspartyl-tRNA(Asn)/glutamyl-tRNA(Gln) amidotransferase subunit A